MALMLGLVLLQEEIRELTLFLPLELRTREGGHLHARVRALTRT